MKHSVFLMAAAVFASLPAFAVEAVPQLLGRTYELTTGDDPVEAFAAAGVSVTGASYVMKARDGARFRVDRAASGRQGLVIISRATRDVRANRAEWQVTSVVATAVDTDDAFTADCKAASPSEINFLYYQADKAGGGIRKIEASFRLDAKSGKVEAAKLSAADCRPGG